MFWVSRGYSIVREVRQAVEYDAHSRGGLHVVGVDPLEEGEVCCWEVEVVVAFVFHDGLQQEGVRHLLSLFLGQLALQARLLAAGRVLSDARARRLDQLVLELGRVLAAGVSLVVKAVSEEVLVELLHHNFPLGRIRLLVHLHDAVL